MNGPAAGRVAAITRGKTGSFLVKPVIESKGHDAVASGIRVNDRRRSSMSDKEVRNERTQPPLEARHAFFSPIVETRQKRSSLH
jgi:hypothetical protein